MMPWAPASAPPVPGQRWLPSSVAGFKVWDGAEWVTRAVKVWDGAAWVTRPVKMWDGQAWV